MLGTSKFALTALLSGATLLSLGCGPKNYYLQKQVEDSKLQTILTSIGYNCDSPGSCTEGVVTSIAIDTQCTITSYENNVTYMLDFKSNGKATRLSLHDGCEWVNGNSRDTRQYDGVADSFIEQMLESRASTYETHLEGGKPSSKNNKNLPPDAGQKLYRALHVLVKEDLPFVLDPLYQYATPK